MAVLHQIDQLLLIKKKEGKALGHRNKSIGNSPSETSEGWANFVQSLRARERKAIPINPKGQKRLDRLFSFFYSVCVMCFYV